MLKSKRMEVVNNKLKKYVEYFWEVESLKHIDLQNMLLPVVNNDIILYLSIPITYYFTKHLSIESGPYFQGPRNRSIDVTQSGKIFIVGVTFKRFYSAPFCNLPLKDVVNQIVLFDKLNIDLSRGLEVVQDSIENYLLSIINTKNIPLDHTVTILESYLESEQNLINFCYNKNINKKKLERLYYKYTGLSPKQFKNIYRMQRVNNSILNNNVSSLTNLCYDMGYFDQTHMGKEFMKFHSKRPGDFIDESFTLKSILKKDL